MGFPSGIKFQYKSTCSSFSSIHCKSSAEGKGSWHLTPAPYLSGEKSEANLSRKLCQEGILRGHLA